MFDHKTASKSEELSNFPLLTNAKTAQLC